MAKDPLRELIREQFVITAALRATVERTHFLARESRKAFDKESVSPVLLLRITEALIVAHKAAKIDGDGTTLDYIEDALRHVGERMAKEHGDGRSFKRKRIEPV